MKPVTIVAIVLSSVLVLLSVLITLYFTIWKKKSIGPWSTQGGDCFPHILATYDGLEQSKRACLNDDSCLGVYENKLKKYELRGCTDEDLQKGTICYNINNARCASKGGTTYFKPNVNRSVWYNLRTSFRNLQKQQQR